MTNPQPPSKSKLSTSDDDNPMENNLIHWLLVNSNRLQKIPALVIVLFILFGSALIWLIWDDSTTAQINSLTFVLMCLLDWAGLWLLPRLGRSYGPEKPPTLALISLRLILMLVVGLVSPSVWMVVIGNMSLSALALYTTWIEPFRVGVTFQHYRTPKLASSVSPIRLLHIADIHIERITARELRLNALIKEAKPDVIVFSGDFVNVSYTYDESAKHAIRQVIGEWSAPLGVYCVTGTYTVEPLARVQEFVAGLDNLRLLVDEWVCLDTRVGKLNILGMMTTHRLAVDREKVDTLSRFAPSDGINLLLTHAPDVAPEANTNGYDLYLCGHTHGGQMRLPFIGAVFTGSHLGRQFAMGRYDLSTTTVYTSRGIGLEGMGAPRARFLCPPEIIQWEIGGE